MHVPVQLLRLCKNAILAGEEAAGQHGGDDAADELVEGGRYEDLVDVHGQRRQAQVVGQRLDGVTEGGDRRYRERVLHLSAAIIL